MTDGRLTSLIPATVDMRATEDETVRMKDSDDAWFNKHNGTAARTTTLAGGVKVTVTIRTKGKSEPITMSARVKPADDTPDGIAKVQRELIAKLRITHDS